MEPCATGVEDGAMTGTDEWAEPRAEILKYMDEHDVPSISVAVARGGEIVWEEAFGWADREKMLKATPDTSYSIASLTKPMTATGVMVLAERGLIDLQRPVDDYLGDAKLTAHAGDPAAATVERVLGHKAGLPEHYHFFYEDESGRRPPMDDTIRRYGIIVYPPGQVMHYSNIGYGILDYLISRISGKSYADFLAEDVFAPLGMDRSSVGIASHFGENVAQRYGKNGDPVPFFDFDHPGGSAVFASVHDVIRYGMFFLKTHLPDQARILADETIDRMHRAAENCPGSLSGYGLGWILADDQRGFRVVHHGGSMPGVSSQLTLVPSERVAVAVVANSQGVEVQLLVDAILANTLPAWSEHREAHRAASEERPNLDLPSGVLGEWEGEIETCEGTVPARFVFQEDDDIHVKIADQMETLLHEVRFRDGDILKGTFRGQINTSDTARVPHTTIRVEMILRNDVLSGWAAAKSSHYGLSSYIRLRKK